MRRARFKVAPNLGLASRQSKTAETSANVVVESPNESSSSTIEPTVQETYNLVTTENVADLDAGKLQDITQPASSDPAIANPTPAPQVSENTPSCVDKENVIAVVADESCGENQGGASIDDQTQSGGPLSRYKSRSKIRPVIRDAPHRIRTFSSASESEDDLGKRQSRTPLSPVKKSSTKKDNVDPAPPASPAPKVEQGKKGKKKTSEKTPLEIKKAAMRKKFANGQVDRTQLTMFDLIYYNPSDGDRPPNSKEKLQMRLKPYEIEAIATQEKTNPKDTDNAILDELLAEEEEIRAIEENLVDDNKEKERQEEEEDDEEESIPVPQVRLGPDGEIILDDQSLVIDTSEAKRNKNQLANAPVIIENSATLVNYGSWRKRQRSARWSLKETARFYRALSMLGTNFSLMEKLFPNRPRIELKRKFKSEEKNNPQLVDKIISSQKPFDPAQFADDYDAESSDSEIVNKEKSKKGSKVSNKSPKTKGSKGKLQKKSNTIEEAGCSTSGETTKSCAKKTTRKRKKGEEEPVVVPEEEITEIASEQHATENSSEKQQEDASGISNIENELSEDRTPQFRHIETVQVDEADDAHSVLRYAKKSAPTRKADANSSTKDTPDAVLEELMEEPVAKKTKPRTTKTSFRPVFGIRAVKPRIDRASKGLMTTQHCDPKEAMPTTSQTRGGAANATQSAFNNSNSDLVTSSVPTPLDSLLKSPLGQMSLEQGGLTVVENSGTPSHTPSFLVPPALAEANPAFAQAEPGSLVLVAQPNPENPDNPSVHVYRISAPIEPVPT